MSRATAIAAAFLAMSALAAPANPAAAQSPPVRVESHVDRPAAGGAWVSGHVYNDYGRPVARVLVRIEALDSSGAPTATSTTLISETILGYARAPFSVKVAATAPAYRVTIQSFDWDTHLCT